MSISNLQASHDRQTTTQETDAQTVLDALQDDGCRAILEEAATEARTATELSNCCDIPMSTAYRKVESLADAGLLEAAVRINTSGKHPTEYRTCFDDVVISIVDEGQVSVSMA
ncbi:helix-turn-helix domain-containing protein [Halobacteria archaeon AArc-dxtr1]|nr:helix-turn-helix domain-containing protein [Halobacteria archaeon AArc-dxtr1]